MRKMLVEDKMLLSRNLRAINAIFAQGGSWLPGIFDKKGFLFLGLKVPHQNKLHTVTKYIENFEHDDDPAEEYQKTWAQVTWNYNSWRSAVLLPSY